MKNWFVGLMALIIALLGALCITPAQAQTVTWMAQYYDNPYFIGSPAFTEYRNSVGFNWGTNAPHDSFPADGYTVRISSDIYFPAGQYRFYLLSDDGATVTFDFSAKVIDTFSNPRIGETVQGDLTLDRAGVYHIQIDYQELGGSAYIYFAYESLADGAQGPAFPIIMPNGSDTQAPTGTLVPLPSAYWTGQYYPNNYLGGAPVAINSSSGLKLDWGYGAPVANIPVDNFSARWYAVYAFDGGAYYLDVIADDGLRVYLDGVLLIDQWHNATALTYGANITPSAGNHTLTVEYYEAYGVASIALQVYDVTAQTIPTSGISPYNAYATVTAYNLNVRDYPSALTGHTISRIHRNEAYPIIGKNSDASWVQIVVDNITGWVSARWVSATNLANVPITSGQAPVQQPAPTGYTAFTQTEVNLRTAPTASADRILILPQNITVEIVGRNTNATWWQVRYNGTIGWASATYAVIQQGSPNLSLIPISG